MSSMEFVVSVMKNVLEKQKGRPNVNVCTAGENLEEQL